MSDLSNSPLVISYGTAAGTFTFPVETETLDFQMRPVYDSAGRTVKWVEHVLTIKTYLGKVNQALSATTDSDMETLKKILTAAGGELKYQGVGIGTGSAMWINPAGGGGVRDVNWGPRPQLVRWRPLGQVACEVIWQVSYCVPLCDSAAFEVYPLEFCFTVAYSIDQSGYTKRTYSGHVSIPQTRLTQGTRTLTDQADRMYESIAIPLVPSFRRIPGDRWLSEDKCTLNFTIVDVEVGPDFCPPGVIDCKLSHTVSTGKVFTGKFLGVIQGSYEIDRALDRSSAMRYFLAYADARMRQARRTPYRDLTGKVTANVVWPIALTASHPEVYGRIGASFSLTYTFMSRLSDLVVTSGLWGIVPESDWVTWSSSLLESAFHLRGNARQAFGASMDVIVDLCAVNNATLTGQPTLGRQEDRQLVPELIPEQPPPETSWLHYDGKVRIEQRDYNLHLKTLPENRITISTAPGQLPLPIPPSQPIPPPTQGEAGVRPIPGLGLDPSRVGSMAVYPPGPPDTVTQTKAQPDYEVVLYGGAIRAGYPITPPAVISVGGRSVVPANQEGEGFENWIHASWFGLPIYACRWQLRWRIIGAPNGNEPLPVLDDPRLRS